MKYALLWNERSNIMAIAQPLNNKHKHVGLTSDELILLTICDHDCERENEYAAWPILYLTRFYGWFVIGEI